MLTEDAIHVLKDPESWLTLDYDCGEPEACADHHLVVACQMGAEAIKQTQWIPVSERLPMEEPDGRHSASKMVLVYAYNGYSDRFASTDITVDGKWYNYPEPEFEVTHWKPLPEPPKGE